LPTSDKVLLLVSRILNNKDSLPGHVYRQLVEAFRIRATQDWNALDISLSDQEHVSRDHGSAMISADAQTRTKGDSATSSTRRRQDTHAVIKYITATLLETRPSFGCSEAMTEMTATAVESLVFGEVYDMVTAEILAEKASLDHRLLTKICNFELREKELVRSVEVTNLPAKSKWATSYVAVEALRCLPEGHSAVDKLRSCVHFLEEISECFCGAGSQAFGADSLLPVVCQHIVVAKVPAINAEVSFLEGKFPVASHCVFCRCCEKLESESYQCSAFHTEFARDEQLLRGREGYALVTLQAALHYLNASDNFETDIFYHDNLEKGINEKNDSGV
jgi:hypothetical protein